MSKRRIDRRKALNYKKEIYNLGKSFLYAFRGFKFAVDNERNMRIHLSVAVFVLEFSVIFGLSGTQYIQLIILFGLVIAGEMINTAVEALVNLQTQSYEHLAKIAKDVAAGAVLVLAMAAAASAVIMFWNIKKLTAAFSFLLGHPALIALVSIELLLATVFIFFWAKFRAFKNR